MDLCWQMLFNMLSRLVIAFIPRNKCLLISWLQSPSAVILESPKLKSVTVFIVSLSIYHEVMGPDAMILVFWMLSFKPTFSLSSFTFIKRLFSSLLSAIRVVSSAYLTPSNVGGSSFLPFHGVLSARILERVAISYPWGSSWARHQDCAKHVVHIILT